MLNALTFLVRKNPIFGTPLNSEPVIIIIIIIIFKVFNLGD